MDVSKFIVAPPATAFRLYLPASIEVRSRIIVVSPGADISVEAPEHATFERSPLRSIDATLHPRTWERGFVRFAFSNCTITSYTKTPICQDDPTSSLFMLQNQCVSREYSYYGLGKIHSRRSIVVLHVCEAVYPYGLRQL